jgi:hypothetical protein
MYVHATSHACFIYNSVEHFKLSTHTHTLCTKTALKAVKGTEMLQSGTQQQQCSRNTPHDERSHTDTTYGPSDDVMEEKVKIINNECQNHHTKLNAKKSRMYQHLCKNMTIDHSLLYHCEIHWLQGCHTKEAPWSADMHSRFSH